MTNALEQLRIWLEKNTADITFYDLRDGDDYSDKIFNAIVVTKKINGQSIATLAKEIWPDVMSATREIGKLSDTEIDTFVKNFTEVANEPVVQSMITATDTFEKFIGKYIMFAYSEDDGTPKKVYFYKRYISGVLKGIFQLTDLDKNEPRDFRNLLERDDRLEEFEKDWKDECMNDYDFFKQFCPCRYKNGKEIVDKSGNPQLIYPEAYQFLYTDIQNVKMKPEEFPRALSNNPNKPAFSVIDLNYLSTYKPGDTSVVDEWMTSRLRNDQIDIIKKILARTLIADAPDLHGLYIRDESGERGKSTFINALDKAYTKLGLKTCNMTLAGQTDKHSYVQYLGASIAFNADVKSPNFIQTDLYHHVTAGDIVTIDPKGGMPFKAYIKVTPILAGNEPIQYDSDKHHMDRRIAYIEMQQVDEEYKKRHTVMINGIRCWKNQKTFAEQFTAQMYDWLIKAYQENINYNLAENSIVLSKEINEDTEGLCIEAKETINSLIIDSLSAYFEFTGNQADELKSTEITKLFANNTIRINNFNISNNFDMCKLKNAIQKHLENLHAITFTTYKRKKINNHRDFYFIGLKKIDKTETHLSFKHKMIQIDKVDDEDIKW